MMERVQEIFYLETFDIKNRMKDSPDMMIGVDSGRLLCKLNKICGNSKKRELSLIHISEPTRRS